MAHSPDRSPFNSPKRKRPRRDVAPGSSPAYDMEFPAFSQEELAACDLIEAKLSQDVSSRHDDSSSGMGSQAAGMDDPENPFTTKPAVAPAFVGFKSGAALMSPSMLGRRSPTPDNSDPPPEQDYSDWFASQTLPPDAVVGFGSASAIVAAAAPPTFASASTIGFTKASKGGGLLVPSAEAFAKAKQKLEALHDSEEMIIDPPAPSLPPVRPAPFPARNVTDSPATPTPVGFTRPNQPVKVFKSPLLAKSTPKSTTITNGFQTPSTHPRHPLASTPLNAPSFIQASAATPSKPSAKKTRPTPFVTPFKPGMKPGEAGRKQIEESAHREKASLPVASSSTPAPKTSKTPKQKTGKHFDTSHLPNRKTLASSGLKPQSYSIDELESTNIEASILSQITPKTAPYFFFRSPDGRNLGPADALRHLHDLGCTNANRQWVDNHWSLILWKLAGMVSLDPDQERDDMNRRWCWEEVLKQLLYRYEREINQGSRPPLRMISTQDRSSLSPMVLCVAEVIFSEGGTAEDGSITLPYPELVVTDGWYCLRAQIDEPMARAVRRGVIRPGRKLSVVSAKLLTDSKEPVEILEAYDSIALQFHGNSSHLAPWHAKLGFTQPSVATLHSLTEDGGLISLLDVTVTKLHPCAYIEFLVNEEGDKSYSEARQQSEEDKLHNTWLRNREIAQDTARREYFAHLEKLEEFAQRLAKKALPEFKPEDFDNIPGPLMEDLDMMYDRILDAENAFDALQVICTCRDKDAGPLAHYIRLENDRKREKAQDVIADQVDAACPPRVVKCFRVVEVQDTKVCKRPRNRTAQLTIWDVDKIQLSESSEPGEFKVGNRFLVTNTNPTYKSTWMDYEEGSAISMATGYTSKIVGLRAVKKAN